MRWAALLLIAFVGGAALCEAHAQNRVDPAREPRVALVIGNSAYQNGPLENPVNDAEDMSVALRAMGFDVTLLKNASFRQMVEAIAVFGRDLKQGGVGLFYYAGHGVQSKGRNFLIPVNASLKGESDLEFESVDANRVLAAMDDAGNRVNIMVLDACRDNPFARSFRSGARGLAQMEAARGSYIAFATGPGSVASDGDGRNGLYTRHLLDSFKQGDSDIDKVFRRVTAEVTRATGGKQVPWVSSSLTGDFSFDLNAKVSLAQPTTDPVATERVFWESIKESKNTDEYRAYLNKYPNGAFVALARSRMLSRPPTEPASRAPAPGTVFRDCDTCPEMVVVPAGRFTMGSPASEPGRMADEGPQREVRIGAPIAVGKFEVTRIEYAAFAAETNRGTSGCFVLRDGKLNEERARNWRDPGFEQTDQHPVTCVSWDDARAYAAWLARKSGRNYRLLSEAEWEYAARAGSTTYYSWGNDADTGCRHANLSDQTLRVAINRGGEIANCSDNHAFTAAAGSYLPNAFGLYDMTGNVWEWAEDCSNPHYGGAPVDGTAWDSGDCAQRMVRGGSWNVEPAYARSAGRSWYPAGARIATVGFRIARGLP